jgi:hypothetical protein
MAGNDPPIGTRCCTPPAPGLRMLTFPDCTQAGVLGLDEIFAAAYREGKQAAEKTAEEIVERLSVNNYIAPAVRQQYCDLMIEAYGKYVASRARDSHTQSAPCVPPAKAQGRTGLLSRLFKCWRSTRAAK